MVALAAATLAGCAPPEEAPAAPAAPTEGVYGRAPLPVSGSPSVVTLRGATPVRRAPAEPPAMDQLGLQFSPRKLVARVGEPMRFTNSESLAHNVHVTSIADGSTLLDEDTPPGGSLTFVFDAPGAYVVQCGTHPGMSAFVFATRAPYAVISDDDGAFRIDDVAPGEYTLTVWSADPGARAERTITVRAGAATEVVAVPSG